VSLPIVWTRPASANLVDLYSCISESSVFAAENQASIILNAADSLMDFPGKGRPGRLRGTRELVVSGTPYIIAYRIRNSTVRILAVIHGARRWPRSLGE